MAFIYWLSKFSREAILLEMFLIASVTFVYFGYLLIQKRRYGAARRQIPDHIVRAYLVEMISKAEGFKNQLFGSEFKMPTGMTAPEPGLTAAAMSAAAASAGLGSGGASSAELAALKAQMAAAAAKQDELSKTIASLSTDKAALEAKLAATPAAGAGGPGPEIQDKLNKLEARLAEYEVIEDDLANLKKYQQENKQLKAQLDAMQAGGTAVSAAPAVAAPAPVAAAPAAVAPAAPTPVAAAPVAEVVAAPIETAPTPPPADTAEQLMAAAAGSAQLATDTSTPVAAEVAPPSPIAAAEEAAGATKVAESFEGLVDKVEQSLANDTVTPNPTAASAVDPVAAAAVQTAAPVGDAVVAEAAPTDAPKGEKSDADLLNEFERMLSS